MQKYDMCVDYESLCDVEDKLKKIADNLNKSSCKMSAAIQRSQDFLSGQQFEKAKSISETCNKIIGITESNINEANKYINDLKELLTEYSKCMY